MRKPAHAPMRAARRIAVAGVVAALGTGVTAAYADSPPTITLDSPTVACTSTTGGTVTFTGKLSSLLGLSGWSIPVYRNGAHVSLVSNPSITSSDMTGSGTTRSFSVNATINNPSATARSYKAYLVAPIGFSLGSATFTVDCSSWSPTGSDGGSGGTDTPELGSGELLATGLVPIGVVLLYRRRRKQR